MSIFEITSDALVRVDKTTFSSKGITEGDLQRLLRQNIGAIDKGCYVLAKEYGNWGDSNRKIDLLCLDVDANLVVVELKRTEDAGHGELQAIRYAAMIHLMTFEEAVNAHAEYRKVSTEEARPEEARQAILEFLGWESVNEAEFAKDVRIVLVSADFKKEITSVAIWLSEKKGIDFRCVRMTPYTLGDKVLVDIQQIVPLPEAQAYQVQLRKKVEEERQITAMNKDFTKYDLTLKGETQRQLTKRRLCFSVVQALSHDGVKIEQFMKYLPKGMWLSVDGKCDHEEFAEKVDALGKSSVLKRYYTQNDELLHWDGKTYAFTNQISISTLDNLNALLKEYPASGIAYCKSVEE